MNKDFIRGMNAGSQPFADVFHKMQSECENMRLDLIGNLENMSRNVSDFGKYLEEVVIKNEFGINPEFDPAEILEKHECQYLVSVIFQISNEMFDRGFITSYEQKQFACSIMTYLEILEPQENIPLDTLGKIDSVKSLRCIMQIIMEYLFLYKGSSEFFNDKEFKKYTNIAHLKYSEIVDIIRNIERRFNLHGAEGFYEPYKQGAVIKQVKKQIQKKSSNKNRMTLSITIVTDKSHIKYAKRMKQFLESQKTIKYSCSIMEKERSEEMGRETDKKYVYLIDSKFAQELYETGNPSNVFDKFGCCVKVLGDGNRIILENNKKYCLDGERDKFIEFYIEFCTNCTKSKNVEKGINKRNRQKEKVKISDYIENAADWVRFKTWRLPFVLQDALVLPCTVWGLTSKGIESIVQKLQDSSFDSSYVEEVQKEILMVALAQYFQERYL